MLCIKCFKLLDGKTLETHDLYSITGKGNQASLGTQD